MKIIKKKLYYKLFKLLSKKRKRQLFLLIILLILNGVIESFSIASIIPFLSIAISKDNIYSIPFVGNYTNILGINNSSDMFLVLTISLSIFIIFSILLRIYNLTFISKITAKVSIDLSFLIINNNMYRTYIQYTRKNSSEIISLAQDKVDRATSAIYSLLTFLSSLILSVSIIISLFLLNWQFALIAIAGMPDRRSRKYMRLIAEKLEAIEPDKKRGRGLGGLLGFPDPNQFEKPSRKDN